MTLLLSLLPPSLMVVPEHNIVNFSSVNLDINMFPHNIEPSNECSVDTTVNIYWRHPISPASMGGPCSNSPFSVNSSLPSEINYAECISMQNNMDIEVNTPMPNPTHGGLSLTFNFSYPISQPTQVPCAYNAANESNSICYEH